jgi:serine kinase of HPr protein (carbohydrate metabolism regulator)
LFTLRLELVESLKAVAPAKVLQCINEEAPYFWIFDEDGSYSFGFSYTKSHPDCVLKVASSFGESVVYVAKGPADRLAEFAISNAVMLLYTFFTAPYDTMMVHASVIAHGGQGYMFLGKSGTGKSTHSRLWLNHIDDTELLNDDNPVLRIVDGKVRVYGTPWSGKTPCYKNLEMPLGGIVRLSQAPYNKIQRLMPLMAYTALMPSCSCMRWEPQATEALHKAVEKVIMNVPCWHLECLPDEEAARVCNAAVTGVANI